MAATPETVERYVGDGFDVFVETDAGLGADFSDETYTEAGAEIVDDADTLWSSADVICKVRAPTDDEVDLLDKRDILISLLWPAQNEEMLERISERGATAFALDAVPRITRAQSMDVLSSMAGIAGYRAVIEAANEYGRF
ncbi:MAG: NAD(P)(+) transhydrogenase (Re/Si-specific) subunit alpha, partial [Bradymonadaceae bacterium]